MYNSKYNKIIFDVLSGSFLIGLISYFTLQFDENPEYLKIIAYLWAVPLLYFYFLYIIYPKGNEAIKSFTIHGLFGNILTFIIMVITYYLIKLNVNTNNIILFNIIYGLLSLFIYFYFKLYLKF